MADTTQKKDRKVKICLFGHYDPDYAHNRLLKDALLRSGFTVVEINSHRRGTLRYVDLMKRALVASYDLIIVMFPGHTDMPLAWIVSRLKRCPLIFDAFVSRYENMVLDRRTVPAGGLQARRLYYTDLFACRLADLVLLDTDTHIRFFIDMYNLPDKKFRRLWVGSDDDIMYPGREIGDTSRFHIFFYGSFIPLQGIEYIIQAAHLLELRNESVEFTIAGSGQTFSEMQTLAKNLGVTSIEFLGRVPYRQLPELMSAAHLCLGIFGTTPKAQRVIPNKVFDGLAMRRPVLSGDTTAVRECLVHGKHIWLCPPGNSEALADAIVHLKNNKTIRNEIANNGFRLFQSFFSKKVLQQEITNTVQRVLHDSITS